MAMLPPEYRARVESSPPICEACHQLFNASMAMLSEAGREKCKSCGMPLPVKCPACHSSGYKAFGPGGSCGRCPDCGYFQDHGADLCDPKSRPLPHFLADQQKETQKLLQKAIEKHSPLKKLDSDVKIKSSEFTRAFGIRAVRNLAMKVIAHVTVVLALYACAVLLVVYSWALDRKPPLILSSAILLLGGAFWVAAVFRLLSVALEGLDPIIDPIYRRLVSIQGGPSRGNSNVSLGAILLVIGAVIVVLTKPWGWWWPSRDWWNGVLHVTSMTVRDLVLGSMNLSGWAIIAFGGFISLPPWLFTTKTYSCPHCSSWLDEASLPVESGEVFACPHCRKSVQNRY